MVSVENRPHQIRLTQMMQDSLRNTIDAYADIIEGVEDLEISQKNVVSRLKVKLRLFDGSMLWVREVWVKARQ